MPEFQSHNTFRLLLARALITFNYKRKVITFTDWQLKRKGILDWESVKYKYTQIWCVHDGALFEEFPLGFIMYLFYDMKINVINSQKIKNFSWKLIVNLFFNQNFRVCRRAENNKYSSIYCSSIKSSGWCTSGSCFWSTSPCVNAGWKMIFYFIFLFFFFEWLGCWTDW